MILLGSSSLGLFAKVPVGFGFKSRCAITVSKQAVRLFSLAARAWSAAVAGSDALSAEVPLTLERITSRRVHNPESEHRPLEGTGELMRVRRLRRHLLHTPLVAPYAMSVPDIL
eukprot:1298371-Rhodomonas_salina.2